MCCSRSRRRTTNAPAPSSGARSWSDGNRCAPTRPIRRRSSSRSPKPFAPGVRLLDNLPILPRHKLGAALKDGTFAKMWGLSTPPADLVGLGPFVLKEYVPGQRLEFARNPRYWRKDANGGALPYLDRVDDRDRSRPGRRAAAPRSRSTRHDDRRDAARRLHAAEARGRRGTREAARPRRRASMPTACGST